MDSQRTSGSVEDFERDWAEALATRNPRWLVFPDLRSGTQVGLLEWVKAHQVLEILAAQGIRSGRVLEYGCGAAGMSVFLQNHGFRAVGADISEKALAVARANHQKHGRTEQALALVATDSLALPMADGTFDVVMSYGLLEHFASDALDRLLGEVVRVLRPGGSFIADIVPSRLNARALATVVNFTASAAYHVASGRIAEIRPLARQYFGHYYETSTGPTEWKTILHRHGLVDVEVRVCRPFPPLAVGGSFEAAYVHLMRALLPLWRRFDRANPAITQYWGWMYLASGIRQ